MGEYSFLKWLGHASFLLKARGLNVFIDPFRIGDVDGKADIIFITHPHFDHLNESDIAKLEKKDTRFVAPVEAAQKLEGRNVVAVKPADSGEILGIKYEAIAAYNTDPARKNFHKKESGWVGYIITVNGKRIYHPGDTDLIEEMRRIDVDLALIPCGGKYVMDIDDAIRATKVMRAKNFAPMHYRALLGKEGSEKLEKKFLANVKGAILLEKNGEPLYSF